MGFRHVPCPGAFYLHTSVLAKHDVLPHFLLIRLHVYAPMFYMTVFSFDDLNPMKISKIYLDPGSSVPGSWQDFGIFSRNFGEINDKIESDVKGGHKLNKTKYK